MEKTVYHSELEQKIKEILSDKSSFPIEKIKSDSSLVNDLGIDSFTTVEIMFAIDHEFEIKISQNDIAKFKTVQDIVNKLELLLYK